MKTLLNISDSLISKIYINIFGEKNSLIILTFHSIFKNDNERLLNLIDPNLAITIDQFKFIIEYFKSYGYVFVSPYDIINNLNNNEKYVLLTFDDGYYNNIHVLPILIKNNIPAVFFITTSNIKNFESYWWDVIYRELKNKNYPYRKIRNVHENFKNLKFRIIKKQLMEKYGKNCLEPKDDIDRPFTKKELEKISSNSLIHLGNHTKNHAILPFHSNTEIWNQINHAQYDIEEITGKKPIIIAYPNGNYSDIVIENSKKNGLKIGVTTAFHKNYLPINRKGNNLFKLGRFDIGTVTDILTQCQLVRNDSSFYNYMRNFVRNI